MRPYLGTCDGTRGFGSLAFAPQGKKREPPQRGSPRSQVGIRNHRLKLFKPEPGNIDKKLFLRKNYKWRRKNFTNFISESFVFNTVSNVVGKHKAIKKLIIYSDNKIHELSNCKPPPTYQLKWTASKVLLMELIYSLYLIGFINQGKVELTELVLFFETNFDIKLNNHNNIIQDIKMRKINKYKLLDQLKEVLSNKLDT